MRRQVVILGILAIAVLFTSTLLPAARAEIVPRLIIESLQATPVDTNGDGLYDEVRAIALVDVVVAGNFRFVVYTCPGDASTGYEQASSNTDLRLGLGPQTVTAVLPSAFLVAICPPVGPYWVGLGAMPISTDGTLGAFNATAQVLLRNANMTAFDPAYASVDGPVTDSAVDTNGDGLYDLLVVHVPIRVLARGRVAIDGEIAPVLGLHFFGGPGSLPESSRVLDPGSYVWDVAFAGSDIRALGRSGPLNATLTLTLDDLRPSAPWQRTWTFSHRTATYLVSAFAPAPLSIGPGAPVVANASSAAPFTEIDIPVSVANDGDYSVSANLGFGQPGNVLPSRLLTLTPGRHAVPLYVSKALLAQSGGGDLTAWISVSRLNGTPSSAYWSGDLGSWSPGAFALPPEVNVTVQVTSGLPSGSLPLILAADPASKFLASPAYVMGGMELSLYPGTFDVVASLPAPPAVFVGRMTVGPGTTQVAVSLTPVPAPGTRVSVSVDGWNATSAEATVDVGAWAPLHRVQADACGDFDGNATASELRLFDEQMLSAGGVSLPFQVSLDNVSVSPGPSWIAGIQGAGSILSTQPLGYSRVSLYEDPYAPVAGTSHRIDLEMPYTNAWVNDEMAWTNYSVVVQLFDSATPRNATLVSHMPEIDGAGFLFAPNATLVAAGPNTWSFRPGARPSSQFASNVLLFRIDATGPAYLPPPAVPPTYPTAPTPPVDLRVVGLGLALVGLIAVLSAAAVVMERRRQRKRPPVWP